VKVAKMRYCLASRFGLVAAITIRLLYNSDNNIVSIELEILGALFLPVGITVVKLGLWHWGRNIDLVYSRIGSWERYLGLRGKRQQGTLEDCIMRSFMNYTPYQILLG